MAPAEVWAGCPRQASALSCFFEVIGELAVGHAAMREAVLFVVGHFGESLLRSARLEPGVPSEPLISARFDEHFAFAVAEENVTVFAVPIGDATLRFRRAIVERVRDRGESLASGGFEQPSHVRTGEVSELFEA